MTFQILQSRLISVIRLHIQSGETTERGFARRMGVSQPHIHNVLKGVRTLSPETSDRILEQLGLTVLDLVVDPPRDESIRRAPERPHLDKFPGPAGLSAAS